MKKTTVIYGLTLALIAFILKTIEYKWLMKELSPQIYILFIALSFSALGAWLAHKLFNKPQQKDFCRNEMAIKNLGLSDRELEVLYEVCKGYSNKKIAEELFISINTVKTHLKKAFEKLEVNNRLLAIEKLKSLNIVEK